jgi:hypothetical protein
MCRLFFITGGTNQQCSTIKKILGLYMNKISAVLITISTLTAPAMGHAASNTLASQTGSDIGLSLSSYQYQEPGIMSLKGSKLGLDLRTTRVLQNEQFIRGDLRYAFGSVDYTGTGSLSGLPDWYIEARGLVGKDWTINDAVLSPYIGLGYRYLSNDARGISSTGASGYRRVSNYIYLPIGVIHRITFNVQARLLTELEYDYLISGTQISRLSDAGLGYGDITNTQSSGYGLKLSLMYEKDNWAIGPYLHQWNIDQSDNALVYQNGVPVGIGWEPKNDTVEFGMKARQQF